MEAFEQIMSGSGKYVIFVIGALILVYIPVMIVTMRKRKRQAGDFLKENPNAAKVYIAGAASGHLAIHSVNDKSPVLFYEGAKYGAYILPGDQVLELSYVWSRPGVLSKTVTTQVGPSKVQVTAEPSQVYELNYNKSKESFIFTQR